LYVSPGVRAQVSPARATAVHPIFDLSKPETSPFPSDRFTLADDRNLTGRRINLPKPVDCIANKSECEDVDVAQRA